MVRITASAIALARGSSDSIAATTSCGAAMPPKVSSHSSFVVRCRKIDGWQGCATAVCTPSREATSPA